MDKSLIFEKFNQFRKGNKHTDVNICVDGISFPCHRMLLAASCDYFDKLFSGYFRDGKEKTIQLEEVNPVAFSEILEFIYAGQVDITGENVCRIRRVSDYLGIQYIEEKCTNYIYENYNVKFFPDICIIMAGHSKETIRMKLAEKIISQFESLLQMDCFLDTPVDVMKIIIKVLITQKPLYLKSSGVIVFHAIRNWYQRNSKERCKVFENIIRTHYSALLCSSEMHASLFNTKEVFEQDSESSIAVYQESIKDENLLLYVRATDYQNNKRRVLEVGLDANGKWMESANKMVCSSVDYLKTVFACNKQYFLTYKCEENQFWSESTSLKCPPVTFLTYSLAVILEENIYLYGLPVSTAESDQSQFLYYNIEIDKWFPLQVDQSFRYEGAKLVPFNNTLLCAYNRHVVKLFDHRTHMWYDIKHSSTKNYVAACVNNGHIFLTGVDPDYTNANTETYYRSGCKEKYQNVSSSGYKRINQCRLDLLEIDVTKATFFDNDKTERVLVPFKNRYWYIYRNLQAEIFDPKESAWMRMPPVSENVKLLTDTYRVQELYDAVVSRVSVV